jgi:DNA-binding XRE family transcriptional regulator
VTKLLDITAEAKRLQALTLAFFSYRSRAQETNMEHQEGLKEHEALGNKIRRLRAEIGVGQERLAIEANVDQSGLSKFERGKDRSMSRNSLDRIAHVLGLTYEQLIEGTKQS